MNVQGLNDKHFPVLKSAHLRLDEIRLEHLNEFQSIAYFEGEPISSREKVVDLIEKIRNDFVTNNGITWGLYLEKQLIGSCGFYRGFNHQIGEIGYVLNEQFRSKGFMKEACEKVIEYGFEQLNLKAVCAYTKDSNLPSIKLLIGLGFSKKKEFVNDYRKYCLMA